MKHILLLLTFSCILFSGFAQEFTLSHELSEKTEFTDEAKDYNLDTISVLKILEERTIEFAYNEENILTEFFCYHQIVYINSDNAIDDYNKIYIPIRSMNQLEEVNCRVISPNREIKTFNKSSMIEGVNDNAQDVYYFAVSGAEKGSYIEYSYLLKRKPKISGSSYRIQSDCPIVKSVFNIISPSNLVFATKSLNGYSEFEIDTSLAEKNYKKAITYKIPKITHEEFSNMNGNKMRIIFQLGYNSYSGKRNPYNYGIASQNIYDNLNKEPSRYAIKEMKKILKSSSIKYAKDEADKIYKIEDYLKTNFVYNTTDSRLGNLDDILKLRAFNEFGATTLFHHLFKLAEIKNEILITSDRYKMRFEKDFESYAFLDDYVLYFPSIDKYLKPSATLFRLGLIPHGNTGNYGLFIKGISIGDITTGIGEVRYIEPLKAEQTQHNLTISAKINASMDSLELDCKQTYTGYYAQNFQPIFDYIAKDELKEFEESLVEQITENIVIKEINIENKGTKNVMVAPFIIKSKCSSNQLFDIVDNTILLKFGELIGPQAELYQNNKRELPVENTYNREYNREITFFIPAGYTIKNPEASIINVQPFKDSGDRAGFVSSYTIEDNKIVVVGHEYYKELIFPKKDYEKYRSVINAASDFNKIVFILEKK